MGFDDLWDDLDKDSTCSRSGNPSVSVAKHDHGWSTFSSWTEPSWLSGPCSSDSFCHGACSLVAGAPPAPPGFDPKLDIYASLRAINSHHLCQALGGRGAVVKAPPPQLVRRSDPSPVGAVPPAGASPAWVFQAHVSPDGRKRDTLRASIHTDDHNISDALKASGNLSRDAVRRPHIIGDVQLRPTHSCPEVRRGSRTEASSSLLPQLPPLPSLPQPREC